MSVETEVLGFIYFYVIKCLSPLITDKMHHVDSDNYNNKNSPKFICMIKIKVIQYAVSTIIAVLHHTC